MRLKQALLDALYDDDLSNALDNGLREHRYHYAIVSELFDLFREIVGYAIVHELTEAERYSDAYSEPEPEEYWEK